MKYRCKMCGYEGEGAALPTTECPSCGMEGEWEANPFDARCTKCGQGYYESEKPNFCPNCGNRIAAPLPSATIKGAPAPSPSKGINLTTFLKVLAWVAGIALACLLGYYAVIWIWAALCFIARHWFISLIVFTVLVVIIGAYVSEN